MKINVKTFWKTKKKWIIGITAGVAAAAVGCGVWYQAGHSSSEPVYVFPFQYVGMTEYWGDSQESYGPVTTDKIQTVFLTDTQTVTEILVQAGDTVKKGDLLMTFDTTLSDLQLERKRLDDLRHHPVGSAAGTEASGCGKAEAAAGGCQR